MKPTFLNATSLAQPLRVVLALGALALGNAAALSQLQPKSPVGTTWDCLLGGARNGVAYISFSNDGTFSGYEVLVPTPPPPSPRQSLVIVVSGSNGLGAQPTAAAPTNRTELFGASPVNGVWGLDSRGRIIGSFLEIVHSDQCTTTAVPVSTNLLDSLDPVTETNLFPVSFSVTIPLSTNKAAGTFKNQTVSYMDQVPISTNSFDALAPISETHVFASGFSVTVPVSTNLVPAGYLEQTLCYATNLVAGSSSFESLSPIASTNTFPDGTFCITLPTTRDDVGNYTEVTTCYVPAGLVSSNITVSLDPVTQMATNSGGIFCVTAPISTNWVPGSYKNLTVSYVVSEDCTGVLTNFINFTGTVVPGKRLTLLGTSTLGRAIYRGVPAVSLADISGSWGGVKRQSQASSFEFFELADAPYTANSYQVSGNGLGYTYNGLALLSSQKRIALAFDVLVGTNYQTTRAVYGPFNSRKSSSTATGLDAATGTIGSTNRVSFQIYKRTSLP